MNGFNGNNDPYNIFDSRGKPKNIGWSVASVISAVLSFTLSIFGWAGLVLGISSIAFAIAARIKLGYFNGWAIAGILIGIFGTVFSASMIFISYTNPDLIKEIFGFVSVPGTENPPTTPPTAPPDTNTKI